MEIKATIEQIMERFSAEFNKTKTKVIALSNHNRRKRRNEPITERSKRSSSDNFKLLVLWNTSYKAKVNSSLLPLVN